MIARASAAIAVLLSSTLLACRSAPPPKPRAALPFHVAIVPFEARSDPDDKGPEDGIDLELDGAKASAKLVETLEEGYFAKATLLSDVDPAERETLSEAELRQRWVASAREAGADLLMTLDLEYRPRAKTETNDKFWLNLPLFLLGGPATWFVDDRDYDADAQLVFRLYDVSAIEASAAESGAEDPFGNREALMLEREQVEPRPVTMNFLDRAGTSGGWYGVSIFWPSGFLVPRSDTASERLGGWVVEDLCTAAATQLHARESEIVRPLSVDFFLEEGSARRRPDGKVELSAKLYLRSGKIENLSTCTAFSEGREREIGPIALGTKALDEDLTRGGEPVYRYEIATVVDLPPHEHAVRLEVKDSGRIQRLRSFTLPVR